MRVLNRCQFKCVNRIIPPPGRNCRPRHRRGASDPKARAKKIDITHAWPGSDRIVRSIRLTRSERCDGGFDGIQAHLGSKECPRRDRSRWRAGKAVGESRRWPDTEPTHSADECQTASQSTSIDYITFHLAEVAIPGHLLAQRGHQGEIFPEVCDAVLATSTTEARAVPGRRPVRPSCISSLDHLGDRKSTRLNSSH